MSSELAKQLKETVDDLFRLYRKPIACEKIIHLLASAKQVLNEEGYYKLERHVLEHLISTP